MGGPVRSARGRARVVAGVCVLGLAACSVSTPRHGFSARGADGVRLQGGTAADGAVGGSGGDTSSTVAGVPAALNDAGRTGGTAAGAGVAAVSRSSPAAKAAGSGGAPGGTAGTSNTPGTTAPAASTVGVAKDSITISAIAGFSGNYGAVLSKIYDNGFQVWVDDLNSRGGINGRKVIAKKVDNQDTVEGGVAACKEVQNNGSYMAVSIVGFGGADVSAVDCLDHAGITSLAFNMSAFSNSWKHVYSAGDAGKQTAPLASYIANVIGDHGKIGVFHTNDPVNTAAHGGLVAEMQRLHMNLVHEETVTANQASFVSELSRMQQSGATTVALIVNTNEVLGILRDAKAIGYAPNWTGNYWDTDENTAAARAVFEGVRALRNYSSTNSPAFPDYVAKAHATHHDDLTNSTTMALYGMGLIVGQVLQNAGTNPTRDSVGPAIEQLVNYNNQITMTLSFGPGNHVADVGMWPIKCCNSDNTWQGAGDPKKAF